MPRERSSADEPTLDDAERIPDVAPRHTPVWAFLSAALLALEAWLRSHGGKKLQYSIRAFWAMVGVAGLVLTFGPVINKPMELDDITSSASSATETWIARKFDVDYTITRAPDGTVRAEVVETIDALFPEDVRERGIERVLATNYQGHDLAPSDIRATLDGAPIEVGRSATPDQLRLSIMSEQELTGDHQYVLEYTLHHLAYQTTDEASGAPIDMLEWDVFGPSWPQGFAALDVTVTLPEELDERLLRQPRGGLAWTLLAASDWIEAEADAPPGTAVYNFTNEQNMPPHSNAWFTMPFEAETFTMPPKSTLWWVQTFGPLAPLAFLAVTLLFALAARAVAWSDERGRPWFTAQAEPPREVSPRLAAQILRAPRTMELAEALESRSRVRVAQVARRAGRVGDLPRALTRYLRAGERREQLRRGLRRIPHGFVRDLFIAAPTALTIVQWGLVRQLSHQATLAIVWWPVAFVLVSSAIALIVLAIALSARPLTKEGALIRQHLLGIEAYAERTQLLDRTTTRDRLLPYVVLFGAPRATARRVGELAAQEATASDDAADREPDPEGYLSPTRILVRLLALALVGGSIAIASTMTSPYNYEPDALMYEGDLPGTWGHTVRSFEASAELSRGADDRAVLEVSQTALVDFDDSMRHPPQYMHQWPRVHDGHDLGLEIERVTVGGKAVPFDTGIDGDDTYIVTRMVEVVSGEHEVRIDYRYTSAATAADAVGGDRVDRVRWAALVDGWEYDYGWDPDDELEPFTLELRIPQELEGLVRDGGWLTKDPDTSEVVREWMEAPIPFGTVALLDHYGDDAPEPGSVTEDTTSRGEDGARVHLLELRHGEHDSYPSRLGWTDLGTILDFPEGTFAGPDASALDDIEAEKNMPTVVVGVLSVIAVGLGLLALARGPLRETARRPGLLRDMIRWLAPASALGALILFFWASAEMASDHPALGVMAVPTLAGIAAAVTGLILTRRRKKK
ncbi:DUF2207 domain-containing protein [Salinibacterium sp. GXW1014]|uniref:DUF2207 domain-containing protein n=1 Tax=Salinibacterium sp. GXW1014 TaxID=3377838 RepID=UPI00383B8F41